MTPVPPERRPSRVSALAVPVLAYHANNISDNEYAGNDHVALATDLVNLHRAGWRFVSLDTVVDWQQGRGAMESLERSVALTFDDGSDFDYRDIDHPACGPQRSLFNLLRDFVARTRVPVCAASFVIASPEARHQLDERSLIGRGWWNDDWWPAANASGLMTIESHGWDHLHPVLDRVAQRDQRAGDFRAVDSHRDCEAQLRRAAEAIGERAGGRRPRYFAFPWGQYSDYLVEEYLPRHEAEHGYRAAFTTQAAPVRRSDDRWRLPRFVCGEAWRAPEELLALLEETQEPGSQGQERPGGSQR